MYLAIILLESKELLTIPNEWIHHFEENLVRNYNGGIRRWRKEIIFYSINRQSAPNFNLQVRSKYDPSIESCYIANVLKAFNSEMDAENYVQLRRPVLPVNYGFPGWNEDLVEYPQRTSDNDASQNNENNAPVSSAYNSSEISNDDGVSSSANLNEDLVENLQRTTVNDAAQNNENNAVSSAHISSANSNDEDSNANNDTLTDCDEGFTSDDIPKPLPLSSKVEDALSGKIPFILQVFPNMFLLFTILF